MTRFTRAIQPTTMNGLIPHNAGMSHYTSRIFPWILMYVEMDTDKISALKREMMLKRQNGKYFEWLFIQQ
jgi:predicted GIY-YIG superfamily endonuclease